VRVAQRVSSAMIDRTMPRPPDLASLVEPRDQAVVAPLFLNIKQTGELGAHR
jgi:hypothetical protein